MAIHIHPVSAEQVVTVSVEPFWVVTLVVSGNCTDTVVVLVVVDVTENVVVSVTLTVPVTFFNGAMDVVTSTGNPVRVGLIIHEKVAEELEKISCVTTLTK